MENGTDHTNYTLRTEILKKKEFIKTEKRMENLNFIIPMVNLKELVFIKMEMVLIYYILVFRDMEL